MPAIPDIGSHLSATNRHAHWSLPYLGRPWKTVCQPPYSFNCWRWVQWVQARYYKRTVPDYDLLNPGDTEMRRQAMKRASLSGVWVPCLAHDGCIVVMGIAEDPDHVGVYLDIGTGGIVHCSRGRGVVCDTRQSLLANRLRIHQFYTHKTWL